MKQYQELLQTIPLFQNIKENELDNMLVSLGAYVKKYQKNSIVLRTEDKVTALGVILSGMAQITKEDFMGNKTILMNLSNGDLFAETLVFAKIERSPVTIVALKDCEIMFIDYKKIITTCSEACTFHTKLIDNMLRIMADKNIMLNNKLDIISKRSIREKLLAYFLLEIKSSNSLTFSISFTKSELADYLCVDRSALSRELGKMKEEGLLEYNKNQFIIKNKQMV